MRVLHFKEVHRQIKRNRDVPPHVEGDAAGINPHILQRKRKKMGCLALEAEYSHSCFPHQA